MVPARGRQQGIVGGRAPKGTRQSPSPADYVAHSWQRPSKCTAPAPAAEWGAAPGWMLYRSHSTVFWGSRRPAAAPIGDVLHSLPGCQPVLPPRDRPRPRTATQTIWKRSRSRFSSKAAKEPWQVRLPEPATANGLAPDSDRDPKAAYEYVARQSLSPQRQGLGPKRSAGDAWDARAFSRLVAPHLGLRTAAPGPARHARYTYIAPG